jgi:phthiocerol/phenolphthiocerol synthesis type-I polyketide synthase E
MTLALETPPQIAIIGMAGRFPGARNLDEFWRNLRDGVESISFFSDDVLAAEGIPAAVLQEPNYVKAGAFVENAEFFDSDFFGFSPREAEMTDPQQRVFLECAWQALEVAGYRADLFPGVIGVFGGASMSAYLFQLCATPSLVETVGFYRVLLGNDKDYLPAWVSYKLNLTGPSINIQTACSTSLVAVSIACRSLLNYECDMALAGGASIGAPRKSGYLYQEGGISSPDGHCRSFDVAARGSVPGEGVGIVVLKRLEDALRDRDSIDAVIRSCAVNNDGAHRVSFTAPGVESQAQLMTMGLLTAGVEPRQVAFVEAHGSGTPLGDQIELAALAEAYRGVAPGSVALGSVKTNIGHAGAAAGIAGLMKAVLALKHRSIPPSLHFTAANPEAGLDATPFYVNRRAVPLPDTGEPSIAAINSAGMGGTNAHVILEQAPQPSAPQPSRPWQLILLSARTPEALEQAADQFAHHLQSQNGPALADIAYTLQTGRQPFDHRRALVCQDLPTAFTALSQRDPKRLLSGIVSTQNRSVAFLLSGLGDHYPDMGRGLYETESEFRTHVDLCCEILQPILGQDLRSVLYPEPAADKISLNSTPPQLNLRELLSSRSPAPCTARRSIDQTLVAHPALFVIEYALARLWMSWGVKPNLLLGYSLGEYVAACLAGVLALEDALRLVAIRAKLISELEAGAMLAVMCRDVDLFPFLEPPVYLAGYAGTSLTVLAGPVTAVERLREELLQRRILCRQLSTAHAFHTPHMQRAADPLTSAAKSIRFQPPEIPYVSNVTGAWMTAADATDPSYWARHLCNPVRFSEGLKLLSATGSVALEIGPGQMLGSLAASGDVESEDAGVVPLASLPSMFDPRKDTELLMGSLAELWVSGARIDWQAFWKNEIRRRVPLSTYPFQQQRYWVGDPATLALRYDRQEQSPAESPSQPAASAAATAGRSRRNSLPNPYVGPSKPIEETMAALWQNLLGIDRVGIHDNFFQLGGNSLLGIQLAMQVQKTFQLDLPTNAIFSQPTVAELCVRVEEALLDEIERLSASEDSAAGITTTA